MDGGLCAPFTVHSFWCRLEGLAIWVAAQDMDLLLLDMASPRKGQAVPV